MSIKLPYGLDKNNRLVHISEVANSGKDCDCTCPACKFQLIARKGNIKVHHFAHCNANNEECKYGVQTALHLAAKEIIAKYKKLRLPAYIKHVKHYTEILGNTPFLSEYNLTGDNTIRPDRYITIDEIKLESKTGDIIPDIIAEINGETILIEIAVTHFASENKIQKIKELKIPAIEIDLSYLKNNFDINSLHHIVINDIEHKKWLSYPEAEKEWGIRVDSIRKKNDEELRPWREGQDELNRLNNSVSRNKGLKW